MTRLEASAFVESLTVESADALSVAADECAHAMEQLRTCLPYRHDQWTRQVAAARERLITAMCGDEPTQPLTGNERSAR